MKEKEMEDLEKKLRYNSIVTNRDYPFCIFPEPMLHKLFTRISWYSIIDLKKFIMFVLCIF